MKAVAQRYAQALVDVAIEQNQAEKVKTELAMFAALARESADLKNFLESPAVGKPHKHGVVDKLGARMGASKTLCNFLHVLVDQRRVAMLAEIQQAYDHVLLSRLKVAEADVTSARELTAQERDAINKTLETMLGKRVEARYTLDPELIGGARVRVGSTIYDGSVREQLNRLRARLASE